MAKGEINPLATAARAATRAPVGMEAPAAVTALAEMAGTPAAVTAIQGVEALPEEILQEQEILVVTAAAELLAGMVVAVGIRIRTLEMTARETARCAM
jgi:hypothetical protein